MANRMVETSRARAREAVAGKLEPGEEIEVILLAVTRPTIWLDVLVSPLLSILQRTWYLVLTNRRVILLRLNRWSGRPAGIEWIEPREGVRVDRYARGAFLGKLYLRRVSDGTVTRLRFYFRNRVEALAVKSALDQ